MDGDGLDRAELLWDGAVPAEGEACEIEPNGSGRTAIAAGRGPVWSPDGTRIAFSINGDILVMNSDGSGQVNLTPGGVGADGEPAWSPDGSQIAFYSTRSAAGQKIYKMDADGSDVTRVTTDGFSFDRHPAWRPTAGGSRSNAESASTRCAPTALTSRR